MRDPHVLRLSYRLRLPEHISYAYQSEVIWPTPLFDAHLADGRLICEMTQHFASASDARTSVDDYIRAWQISAGLDHGIEALDFVFEGGEIEDRNPPPPPPGRSLPSNTILTRTPALPVQPSPPQEIVYDTYPDPPTQFRATPDVEVMWLRYRLHKEGREPLPAMAYFCLTVVEKSARGDLHHVPKGKRRLRRAAALKYAVDVDILEKFGDLSSERGDKTMARKKGDKDWQPLTHAEEVWLEASIKLLIRRLGEHGAGGSLSQITMNDLPPL